MTAAAIALACALASPAQGSLPDSVQLRPGQPGPAWIDLEGTDGRRHSLADFEGKPAVVVVFFSNLCPESADYEDRLIAVARDYASRGVAMVFLSVGLQPEDALPEMTKRARAKSYTFPYLIDPSQKIGVAYAARTTPTVFVLGPDRKVAYRGAVDDDFKPDRVERRYLRDALDAVLAGRPVATAETESPGCDVEYPTLKPPGPGSGPGVRGK